MTELHDLLVLQRTRHHPRPAPSSTGHAAPSGRSSLSLTTELRRVTADLAAGQIRAGRPGHHAGPARGRRRRERGEAVTTLERRLSSTSVPRGADDERRDRRVEGPPVLDRRDRHHGDHGQRFEPLDTRLSAGAIERASLEERLAAATASLATSESAVDGELAAARSARDHRRRPDSRLTARPLRATAASALDGIVVATLDGPVHRLPPHLPSRSSDGGCGRPARTGFTDCQQCGRILVVAMSGSASPQVSSE